LESWNLQYDWKFQDSKISEFLHFPEPPLQFWEHFVTKPEAAAHTNARRFRDFFGF
jgi:hypothetical protein